MNTDIEYKGKYYNIRQLYFNDGCYKRIVGESGYEHIYIDDLTAYINLLTNDNNFLQHINDYLVYNKTFGHICICGCDKCGGLFCINHLPTNISFTVGSSCVRKFLGKRNISILKKIEDNKICIQCNSPLYFKKTKYFEKNAIILNCGHCIECWNS